MRRIRQSAARLSLALAATAQLVALPASARDAAAQTGGGERASSRALGDVAGVVHDEAGNEIASVEITIVGTPIRVLTDAQGAFVLRRVPAGQATLRVRRLGFVPTTFDIVVDSAFAPPLDVALKTLPIRLNTVEVRATRRVYSGYMAEFNRRRDSGLGGHFFTRAQIDSIRPYRTTDLLRRIPGISFTPAGSETLVRTRGQRCAPLMWVDGTPATAAYFDPDNINPRTIEGIEIYSGLATVPAALLGPGMRGACGVIAIWTRIGEPRRKKKIDAQEAALRLAALVDSLKVYTVTQVDEAARLDTARAFSPEYPDELRRSRMPGLVIAEFVVDTGGRVEPATLGVVTSSHRLFTAAVDSALSTAVFRPAVLAGRHVRQLVQLPVYFHLPGKGGGQE